MTGARVGELVDAAAAVRAAVPPPESDGAFVDGLRDECGLLIGGVLEVVRVLTGHDLLAELLDELAGDMGAVSSMRAGWLHAAAALGGVEENYRGLAAQLPAVWQGESAAAAGGLVGRAADVQDRQREAALLVAEQLDHVVAVSRATAELVCVVLQFLDGLVQELLLSAAAGPLGWAKAAASTPGRVHRMVVLIGRGLDAVEELRRVAALAAGLVARVRLLVEVVGVAADAGEAGAHTAAALRVDDVTRAGFGDPAAGPGS